MEVVFDDGSEWVRFFSPFISEKEYKLAWRNKSNCVVFDIKCDIKYIKFAKTESLVEVCFAYVLFSYILVFGVCSPSSVRKQALLYLFCRVGFILHWDLGRKQNSSQRVWMKRV